MRNFAANLSTVFSQFYKTSVLAMTDFSSGPSRLNTPNGSYTSGGSQFKKIKRFFRNSPYIPFVFVGIVVLIIAIIIVRGFVGKQPTSTLGTSTTSKQVSVAKPLAQET